MPTANLDWHVSLVDAFGNAINGGNPLAVSTGGTAGAITVADGADVAQGSTTDAAVTGDSAGTISAKLRGLNKILASVWDSLNGRLKVDGSGVTQPVSISGSTFEQDNLPVVNAPPNAGILYAFNGIGFDRVRTLQGKKVSTQTISSGGGIGSTSITFTSPPSGLQPGQGFQLEGGTEETVYTTNTYVAGTNPVSIVSAIANAGHTSGQWEIFAPSGAGTSGMLPGGVLSFSQSNLDINTNRFFQSITAGVDAPPSQTIPLVGIGVIETVTETVNRLRNVRDAEGHNGAGAPGTGPLGFDPATSNVYQFRVESATNPNLRAAIYQGTNEATVTGANALKVDGSAVTQPVSGTVTGNQGTPNSVANSWPVEVTDGTNVLGTAAHPVRTDPTGTTTQPVSGSVSVSNFPATQPVSGTVTANQGTAAGATGGWPVRVSDGSNLINPGDNANSAVRVNVVAGNVGSGQVDESTFTQGTTSFTPVGGEYTTTPASPVSGQAAACQITQNRALHINLRNAAGTEVATTGNPIRTDPTGTTTQPVSGSVSVSNFPATQPVSGTVTANQGTSPWVTSATVSAITDPNIVRTRRLLEQILVELQMQRGVFR